MRIYSLIAASLCFCLLGRGASADHFTDFEGFTTGVSVAGQGGWAADNATFDQSVEDFSGNTVWRASNGNAAGGAFDQPFAPRPGGTPLDSVNDPVNSMPAQFAGESSTGADYSGFIAEFDFRSATGAGQAGLFLQASPDSGRGARQGFVAFQDDGTSGLEVVTFDTDSNGDFLGPITIASGLSYTDFHNVRIEGSFVDGADNDVFRYYVNDALVHTSGSWEQFYTNNQAAQHPLGVPVQTWAFQVPNAEADSNLLGAGLYFDNVSFSLVPEPATLALAGLAALGLVGLARRRK